MARLRVKAKLGRAPEQGFGETLKRNIRNRIRSCGDELTCVRSCLRVVCVYRAHVCEFTGQMTVATV